MSEFSFKSSRGDMLKSMMKHPETASLIREALNSPIGSTSRTKAKKIFSIMNKLHAHNEGMGGPGDYSMQEQSFSTPQPQEPEYNSKGMVIFHKIPQARITYGSVPAIPQKTQSQYLNGMSSFSRVPQQPSFNNISNSYPNIQPGGMGGPGYNDGRGGFFSDVWNGISSGVSNAVGAVGNAYSNMFSGIGNAASAVTGAIGNGYNQSWNGIKDVGSAIATGAKNVYNEVTGQPSSTGLSSGNNNNYVMPFNASGQQSNTLNTGGKNKTNGLVWNPSTVPSSSSNNIWTPAKTTDTSANANPQSTRDNITESATTNMGASLSNNKVNPNSSITNTPLSNKAVSLNVTNGQTGGECGSFVNDYLGTRTFGDSYEQKMSNVNSSVPTPGAVAVIKTDESYGHVAVVESVNSDGTLNLVESNWNKDGKVDRRSNVAPSTISGYYVPSETPTGLAEGNFIRDHNPILSDAQSAVDSNMGSATFALNEAKKTLGGTLSELTTKNQKSIWDKYDIDAERKEVDRMTAEGVTLPKDITNYIKGRDTYIEQTDKEIDKFIDKSMTESDMSNPANAAKANAQLNYLYTLRGRQNQSYIGYLNDAVEQHTNALKAKVDDYNSDITAATALLTSQNAITTEEYKLQLASFESMYNELKAAPAEQMQLDILTLQRDKALKEAAADPLTLADQTSYIDQNAKLKGVIVDKDNVAIPGTDLVQEITTIANDPGNKDITPTGVMLSYIKGVQNYINQPNDNGTSTGNGVTDAKKVSMAKEGIQQLTNLASAFTEAGDNISADAARKAAIQARGYLGNAVSSQLLSAKSIPKLTEQIKLLSPGTGFFGIGARKTPSEETFVKNVSNALGNTIDESISKAIYAAYVFASNNGQYPNAANGFIYPTSSTENWNNDNPYDTNNPFSDEQIAQNIGKIIEAYY